MDMLFHRLRWLRRFDFSRWLLLAGSLLLAGESLCPAGVLRTTDGTILKGEVSFDRIGVMVVKEAGGSVTRVPLDKLLQAVFLATDVTVDPGGALPPGWTAHNIGLATQPGASGMSGDVWVLRGSAGEFNEKADVCHFAGTKLTQDVELTVKVASLSSEDGRCRAGLMLRESLSPNARQVNLVLNAEPSAALFILRRSGGESVTLQANRPMTVPGWLRLQKRKEQILAFKSNDGRTWEQMGSVPNPFGNELYAGLVANNRTSRSPCTARLESLRLTVNGLKGDYFADEHFERLRFSRVDKLIQFGWGLEAPDPRLGNDHFSIRWSGQLEPKSSGNYAFHWDADNEARLWIDGQLLPQASFRRDERQDVRLVPLRAGQRYALTCEYVEKEGEASVRLGWSRPGQARDAIPTSCLFCTVEPKLSAQPNLPTVRARPAAPGRGLVLRNGSYLAGTVQSLDEAGVKFQSASLGPLTLFTHQVARLTFRPPKREVEAGSLSGRTGVLLESGDFLEGEVRALRNRSLKISSVLYGMKSYTQDSGEVSAWILADTHSAGNPWEARLADGTILVAARFTADGSNIIFHDSLQSAFKIARNQLLELRRLDH